MGVDISNSISQSTFIEIDSLAREAINLLYLLTIYSTKQAFLFPYIASEITLNDIRNYPKWYPKLP